ncbi:MAG: hypothetical protein ACTHMI_23880 [Mucilaginibacter sp.]
MSHYYRLYGLSVNSSRKIELLDDVLPSTVDLYVTWVRTTMWIPDTSLVWQQVLTRQLRKKERIHFYSAESPFGIHLRISFTTRHGNLVVLIHPDKINVTIVHSDDEPESNMDSFFVGVISGCIMRLKGLLCLHGSVVNIDGEAVVLVGKKKSGKSTTAKAFANLGFKVLSDDIAVIKFIDGDFFVEPGYPKVRLRPQPLTVFYPDIAYEFVSVYSHRDSKYSDLGESFWGTPLKLGAIYLLDEDNDADGIPFVKPTSAERLVYLHSNTFASYVLSPPEQKKEFELLGRLAVETPVKHLHFSRNVKLVYQQCEVILSDLKKPKGESPDN